MYSHHPDVPPQGAPEGGPPPPATAAETSVQRAEERPGSAGPKRMREWEEEGSAKKQANEENRARLEDVRHRRPSTPPRDGFRRNSTEAKRDDQRRSDERGRDEPRSTSDGYHPSEAAHHQQNHAAPQAPGSATSTPHEKPHAAVTPKEERAVPAEPAAPSRQAPPPSEPERAARKMDVDEDYDDSGEDDKKAVLANGSATESASGDSKTSPTSAGANGSAGVAAKAE